MAFTPIRITENLFTSEKEKNDKKNNENNNDKKNNENNDENNNDQEKYLSFLKTRSADAAFLYSQLLEVNNYENGKIIVDIMSVEHAKEVETIYAFVYFFKLVETYLPANILEIISYYNDFSNYFSHTRFFPFVTYSVANYLIKINIDCNIDYINFSNYIISQLTEIEKKVFEEKEKNNDFQPIIKELQEKQNTSLTNLLNVYLETGQIILLLRNSIHQLNQKILVQDRLIYIISIYLKLQAYEVASYYINQLEKKDIFNDYKIPYVEENNWIGKTEEEIGAVFCNRLYRDAYHKETILIYGKDLLFYVFILKNHIVTGHFECETSDLSKSITFLIKETKKKI